MKGSQRVPAGKEKFGAGYRRRVGELQRDFLQSGDGIALIEGRADVVDELVLAAGRRHLCADADPPAGFSLVAIGGYGRRELFPYSDVDLMLLFERQVGRDVGRESISEFLRELWDAGLRLSQTVRPLSECGVLDANNTEFAVALLDMRFLAGDRVLYERLQKETVPRMVRREQGALLKNLTALAELRHRKYGDTIYHLEPDVKETPGGLRDYHLAGWIATILRTDEKGLPERTEVPEVARRETGSARAFLAAARAHLHLLAGRDLNTLTFDMQEQVAARSRGCTDATAPPSEGFGPDAMPGEAAPEAWMRDYYRHARTVYRLAGQCMRQAATPRSTLFQWFRQRQERVSNADFVVHGGEAFLRNPIQAQRDPALWLDLFEFVARHGVGLSLEAEHRLSRQLPEIADWAPTASELWARFRKILVLPHAYTALAAMHELGLLGALFPEFALIESLVIRDLYHKYTVDEHSLLTIRHLHELNGEERGGRSEGRAKDGEEISRARAAMSDLYVELDQRDLLMMALLFHDAGKSDVEDHVSASTRLVEGILARLDMDDASRDTVRFLVSSHLLLSATLTGRDVHAPETARELAARIGTDERLKMLCLLTWADIRSVNPGALTPWKEEALWQLYVAVHNELTRQLDTDRTTPSEARSVFRAEVADFLEGFPRRYLKTHTPAEILAHHRLALELPRQQVQLHLDRRHGHFQLLVLTYDHPFLFAAITGTLAAAGMSIVKAEAFSNRQGLVLDTFLFHDLHRTLELNPEESERLLERLRGAILGAVDVAKLLEGRVDRPAPGRASYRVETCVRFDNSQSANSTLLEVVARDRTGLLYRIANVLSAHGCNIEVVLVDTQGHKAIDVFYVTRGGAPLDEEWQRAIEKELRRVLES